MAAKAVYDVTLMHARTHARPCCLTLTLAKKPVPWSYRIFICLRGYSSQWDVCIAMVGNDRSPQNQEHQGITIVGRHYNLFFKYVFDAAGGPRSKCGCC